jgi:citrate synthase
MFTVMFAIGRLPGWIAQWKEMKIKSLLVDQGKYTGSPLRDFKTVDKR